MGYGLKNGGIGCVELTRDEAMPIWSLEGSQTNGSPTAIIKAAGEGSDGSYQFIVGRVDGTIEMYSYEHKSPIPTLLYESQVNG